MKNGTRHDLDEKKNQRFVQKKKEKKKNKKNEDNKSGSLPSAIVPNVIPI